MDERARELIARLGSTERVARELVELGASVLLAVDAIAADPTRRQEVRMAASRVAHEIRDRAMRAPPAPPQQEPAGVALGDAFHARHRLEEFVERLRAAGADAVTSERDVIVAMLPHDSQARARLFAIYNAEVDELGEDFGGEEPVGHEMTVGEAEACGGEAGDWVVDDIHVRDTGQVCLRFWWD